MKLSDDLVLLPVLNRRSRKKPQVVIRIRAGLYPVPIVFLNAMAKKEFGVKQTGQGIWVQLFISSTQIQLRKCNQEDPQSRRINSDGYMEVEEMGKLFGIKGSDRFELDADIDEKNLIATYTPELKQRIESHLGSK